MMDLYIDESVVLFFFSHEGETHFHLQSLHFFFFTTNLKNYMCLTFIFKLLHQSSLEV